MQPGKRKLAATNTRAVRVRQPAYFLPELAHVVAAADERVPFVNLAQEVSGRDRRACVCVCVGVPVRRA